jgi:hypothetical protein
MTLDSSENTPTLSYRGPAQQKKPLKRKRWGVRLSFALAALLGVGGMWSLPWNVSAAEPLMYGGAAVAIVTFVYFQVSNSRAERAAENTDEVWAEHDRCREERVAVARRVHRHFPVGRWRIIDATLRTRGLSVVHEEHLLEIHVDGSGRYRYWTGGERPREYDVRFQVVPAEEDSLGVAEVANSPQSAEDSWPKTFFVEMLSPALEGRHPISFEFTAGGAIGEDPSLFLILSSKVPVSDDVCEYWPFNGCFLLSA